VLIVEQGRSSQKDVNVKARVIQKERSCREVMSNGGLAFYEVLRKKKVLSVIIKL
jgi:hypothetical protein